MFTDRKQVKLFLASFLSLFLELLLIRWVPSVIRIVAYYGNLMLMSAFLGLGCGLLLARRQLTLRRWFPVLVFLFTVSLWALKGVEFRQGPDELRFLFKSSLTTTAPPVALIFILNAFVFIPLGEIIGTYFIELPSLSAYSWDLGGAIAGTALFGVFSYFWFSPVSGFVVVMAAFCAYCSNRRQLVFTGLCFALSLGVVFLLSDPGAIWSPYSQITVREASTDGGRIAVSSAPANLGAMHNPPFYVVQVNHDFYMSDGTIDPRRYTTVTPYVENLV